MKKEAERFIAYREAYEEKAMDPLPTPAAQSSKGAAQKTMDMRRSKYGPDGLSRDGAEMMKRSGGQR